MQYDQRVREIEHGSSSPLVFMTLGSMGPTAYKTIMAYTLMFLLSEFINIFTIYNKVLHVFHLYVQLFNYSEGASSIIVSVFINLVSYIKYL